MICIHFAGCVCYNDVWKPLFVCVCVCVCARVCAGKFSEVYQGSILDLQPYDTSVYRTVAVKHLKGINIHNKTENIHYWKVSYGFSHSIPKIMLQLKTYRSIWGFASKLAPCHILMCWRSSASASTTLAVSALYILTWRNTIFWHTWRSSALLSSPPPLPRYSGQLQEYHIAGNIGGIIFDSFVKNEAKMDIGGF